MPTFYVDCDERYPCYTLEDKRQAHITESVELTNEEAKCVICAQVLYDYWQEVIHKRVKRIKP